MIPLSEYNCSISEAYCVPSVRQLAQSLVSAIGTEQWIYWTFVFGAFFLLVLSTFSKIIVTHNGKWMRAKQFLSSYVLFCILSVLTLYVFRWPTFSLSEQNVDESHQIASAIKLLVDPVFWRSIDGITSGPFVIYPLTFMGALGIPIEYGSARVMGVLMLSCSILFLYLSLRGFVSETIARVATLPATVILGCMTFNDYIAYNGEHALVLLFSIAAYFLSRLILKKNESKLSTIFVLGTVIGATPFAKLQAAPVSLFLGIAGLAVLFVHTRTKLFTRVTVFLVGVLFVPGFIIATMSITDQLQHFLYSYPFAGFVYGTRSTQDLADKFGNFWKLMIEAPDLKRFFWAAMLYGGVGSLLLLIIWKRPLSSKLLQLLILSFGYLGCSLVAVVQPNNPYCHYLLLLVLPTVFVASLLYGALIEKWRGSLGSVAMSVAFLSLLLIYPVLEFFPLRYPIIMFYPLPKPIDADKVVRRIHRYAKPGEAMAVWGWMPSYYVKTGFYPATRDSGTERQINGPYQEYYLQRFLDDLKKNKPPLFIDAVGPDNFSLHDRKVHGHETIPELKEFIESEYTLDYDFLGTRVLVRNDRFNLG